MVELLHPGAGAGRRQVALAPGHSMMDWIRLGNSKGRLLAGVPVSRGVTEAELALHNSADDVWMAIKGLVYNVTPYLRFHPGGIPELMRGAGTDATLLFCEVHSWVNFESMLEKCLVGFLIASNNGLKRMHPTSKKQAQGSSNLLKVPNTNAQTAISCSAGNDDDDDDLGSFSIPVLPRMTAAPSAVRMTAAPSAVRNVMLRRDWYQTQSTVTLVYYVKDDSLTPAMVQVDVDGEVCQVGWIMAGGSYQMLMTLAGPTTGIASVCREGPKLLLIFTKASTHQWPQLGNALSESFMPNAGKELQQDRTEAIFSPCPLVAVYHVTATSRIFRFKGTAAQATPPLGSHMRIKVEVEGGVVCTRSYTPIQLPEKDMPPLLSSNHLVKPRDDSVFDLLVKVYPDGLVSSHIGRLALGDSLLCTAPLGVFSELLKGVDALGMVAGGTGITPMVDILLHCKNIGIPTSLLFCNSTEKDILLRDQLNAMACQTVKVQHMVTRPAQSWPEIFSGHVTPAALQVVLPMPDPQIKVLVCGRPSFTRTVHDQLKSLGYTDNMLHIFS